MPAPKCERDIVSSTHGPNQVQKGRIRIVHKTIAEEFLTLKRMILEKNGQFWKKFDNF